MSLYVISIIQLPKVFFFPTSGIRAKVRVEAMAKEEDKASGIEKFDRIDFRYWKM